MCLIPDWILIVISTYITWRAYNRAIGNPKGSIANYVLLVEYVFFCTPILLNYVMGIPDYQVIYWYKSFLPAMNNADVAWVYDIYLLISIICLDIYARYYDGYLSGRKQFYAIKEDALIKNKGPLIIVIFSPILYAVVSGNITAYIAYGIRSQRGLPEGRYGVLMGMLMLLSLHAFCHVFFRSVITKKKLCILILYSAFLAWFQGKRFILAVMALVYFFYLTRSSLTEKQKKTLKRLIPLLMFGLLAFSYFYLVVVRPLSDTSFDSVYEMLRVDFGRDDVIKFVIHKEFFLKEKILDYPGQTFLSTFLTFVPRGIWESKPYPHYMYLTAEILNTSIHSLPAGTTPSWYEMCLANFGIFGFIVGIVFIPVLCRLFDKRSYVSEQMVGLVLLTALLTQSIDAYVSFVLLFLVRWCCKPVIGKKRIRFVGGKDKWNKLEF